MRYSDRKTVDVGTINLLQYTFTIMGVEDDGSIKVLCEIEGQAPIVRYMMAGLDRIVYSPSVRIT